MLRYILSFLRIIATKMLQLLSSRKHLIENVLRIYIKTTNGSTLSIEIDPKYDIKHIKNLVASKIGAQPEELKIIFAGKELGDNIIIEECDLGQQSILHAVKIKRNVPSDQSSSKMKPLCEILDDEMFSSNITDSRSNSFSTDNEVINIPNSVMLENSTIRSKKIHFYVYCPTCKDLKQGKLRVRCHFCKSGAFTVHADPQNWVHVLEPKQITGTCENNPELCKDILQNKEPTFAEFYFKCSEHISLGETDQAVPLDLIRPNLKQIQCMACLDTLDTIFAFPCPDDHVMCLDCFKQYCLTKLTERQFWQHPEYGYTLACPTGCPDSFIKEIHHFRLLDDENYNRYHHFAAEEFVLQSNGLLCPQPGCGMGILAEPECTRISCQNCKYVFCRHCRQGFHIGECDVVENNDTAGQNFSCESDMNYNNGNSGELASRTTIKIMTKPCPSCKTPTERDGGCMHMICTRAGCRFHWCWVCQTEWTTECMGDHWFG